MSDFHNYANAITPSVGEKWILLNGVSRKVLVTTTINNSKIDVFHNFEVLECRKDGQIIIKIVNPMPPSERGLWLLRLESILKNEIDDGISVWAESLGDKNSLRNLRGIKVKS
jgi:hypothetical protein